MFMRNIARCVIIFCIVSLFVGLPLAQAYPNPNANNFAYKTAERERDNALRERVKWANRHNEAMIFVNDLLGKWSGNEQAIKDDTWDTVDAATATLIAELVKRANQDSDDGTVEELVEWLPTVYGTYQTLKSASSAADGTAKRADYLSALNTAVGNLNEVLDKNKKAFNTYEEKYDIYLKIEAEHSGASANSAGLARVPNHSPQGDYSSVTATSFEDIKTAVKVNEQLDSWYHPGDLRSTSQPVSHTIDSFWNFEEYWKRPELPTDKRCGGDCGQQFQTPVEHVVVCPHSLSADATLPAGKGAPAGCDRAYYTCKNDDINEHRIRLCTKNKDDPNNEGQKIICNEPYRNCNNSSYDHGGLLSTKHSDRRGGMIISPTFGFSPASGSSYTASAGSTHTASLTLASVYSSIYWYVKSPSESGLGTSVSYVSGDGSSTSASFSWSVPSGASGDYVITAYTYLSDNSVVQPSYTVTVGSSSTSSTPSTPSTPSTTDDDTDDTSDTDSDDDDSSTASTSPYSLSASSTGSPFQPGDTVTLTLSGNESYYSVDWSLDSPQYSSTIGLSYDSGDGYGSYESSASFTFSSGYPGDYVFTAVVYTSGNMTRYEHTYTVTLGY